MDYHALEKMTVIQLREEAKKFADLKGVTAMKKEELIHILVERLGIAVPDKKHHAAAKGPMNKSALKKKIAELHAARDAARAEDDSAKTDLLRRRLHSLKHRLRNLS
jgi:cysteinyl-tRNA synthetase